MILHPDFVLDSDRTETMGSVSIRAYDLFV